MVAITKSDYVFTHTELMKKTSYFQLHKNRDLCIITLRPPPRWTKWSRGVRTRGLRVGAVGGPRPLLFLGASLKSFSHLPSSSQTSLTLRSTVVECATKNWELTERPVADSETATGHQNVYFRLCT